MELCIEKGKLIREIQKQFSEVYPFLRIELAKDQSSMKVIPAGIFSGQCKHIDVSACRTVAEVEQDFINTVHLPVQVFRRAGSLWIGTSLTHDWTLEQQNREGELFSGIYAGISGK